VTKDDPNPSSLLTLVIANDLIRLSQAHATRHFTIHNDDDDDDGAEQLTIWLFLESFIVASSTDLEPIHKHTSSTTPFPACKIMYRGPTLLNIGIQEQTGQAWAQPDLVEHLQYPKEVCNQLKQALQSSSLLYPPTRRQFTKDWTIGFLQTM